MDHADLVAGCKIWVARPHVQGKLETGDDSRLTGEAFPMAQPHQGL